jgi:hypothetical protein
VKERLKVWNELEGIILADMTIGDAGLRNPRPLHLRSSSPELMMEKASFRLHCRLKRDSRSPLSPTLIRPTRFVSALGGILLPDEPPIANMPRINPLPISKNHLRKLIIPGNRRGSRTNQLLKP